VEGDGFEPSVPKQVTLLEAAPFDVSAAFPSGSGATRPGHTRANSRYRPPFGRGGQAPAARDVEGFFFRRLRSEDKAPSGGCPRTSLPARQCPGELANCLLMLLVPDLGKIAGDLELHTLVKRDLPRTFIPDTVVKIGDRRAQRAGDLK
jgi:hypothetical protein